jgi:arginine/lysine/ornithine decarboxylase
VLNAHSYDGIVYNMPLIIEALLRTGTATRRFLIDEAWAGANPFSDQLRRCASLNAVHLRKEYEDLCIVATQSAHKALSCLRQASMLHVYGSDEMVHKLRTARYRIHTSSPSYPILASLDLARAQMSRDGNELVQQATLLAKEFVENIEADPSLSSYRINSFSLPVLSPYVVIDPTKVSLNVSELTSSTLEFRDLIYANYGIYINRVTKSSLLLNFHIGITSDAVQKILKALRELQRRFIPEWLSSPVTDAFIVPYPPGVPIAIPGEEITIQMRSQIRSLTRSGSYIFVV